jgi:hypothetical protein
MFFIHYWDCSWIAPTCIYGDMSIIYDFVSESKKEPAVIVDAKAFFF